MAEQGNTTGGVEGKLEDLKALSGDIRSCAVLSGGRRVEGSRLGRRCGDRERATAMLAALVNLSERVARENGKESRLADQDKDRRRVCTSWYGWMTAARWPP